MKTTKPIYFDSNFTNILGDFAVSSRISRTIQNVLINNNAVGVAVGYFDDKLSLCYVSDFLLQVLGYDPVNLINNDKYYSLLDFVYVEDKHLFEANYFRSLEGKFDFSIVDLDENPRFVHAYKENMIDEEGTPIWVMSIRASDDIKSLKVLNKMFDNGLWRVSFDTDGDIYKVYWSDKFRQMIGYTNEEDFPNHMQNLLDLIHPFDIDFLKYMFYTSINDKTHEFEFKAQARIKNKNGNYVWYQFNSDINWRPNGTIYEIIGVIVNIDETKRAELDSEHYHAFQEAYTSNDLCEYYVNLVNNTFDRLKVDKSLNKVFNESKTWDDLITNFIDYYVVKEDREALKLFYNRDYINNEFTGGKKEISQESRINLNGEDRIVRNIIMKGKLDQNNEFTNAMVSIKDITEPKKAAAEREEMLASNARMNQLIQGMVRLVDLFAVIDFEHDNYIIYGLNEEEDIEGKCSEFVKTASDDFIMVSTSEPINKVFTVENLKKHIKNENDIYKFEYLRKSTHVVENASIIPVKWDGDNLLRALVIGVDVTDEKKAEAETQIALKEAYEAANKANESKTQFLSNMSHDIRTPMNAIIGMTAIAGAHIDDKDRVLDCLNKITGSSRHLLALINEVLDMSRIESGKVTLAEDDFNLPELIDNLINMVTPDMNKHHHEFDVVINNLEHEDVYGDSLRLQLIFTNLLSNAIKYTPNGGHISFKLSERPTNHTNVGCYEIVIEDNGMGMSKEFVEVIFEPFTRSDDKRTSEIQGTGLGMAITKNIVNMMNGDIKVESELKKGSKFTVTIFLKTHDKSHEIVDELVDLPVLIVDDDLACCESTCTILNQIGMKAEYVTSGKEAIYKVVSKHRLSDDYFVVIMDWKMPEIDGIEATKEIRKQIGKDVPIILLSSFDYADIEQKARAAGIDGFIAKPLFKSRLTATFKQLISKESVVEEVSDLIDISKDDYSDKRVLLVEDNELNREIAKEIISTTKCIIEEAVDGKQALDMVNDKPEGYYDLIFMDIQMPIMNGYDSALAIRSLPNDKGKKMPIVAMTANAFAEDVIMAKNAGMNEHIAKPINIEKLKEVMHQYLA